MSAPRWTQSLLRRLAPEHREEEILGDLEEAHHRRRFERGPVAAAFVTSLEAMDMARALLLERLNPGISSLDFKLGARMLVRYPGLTVLGGLSLTFAIVAGATTFEFLSQMFVPTLDFPDGERVVGIRVWDTRDLDTEEQALWDYAMWQDELTSVEELGAYRTLRRNLGLGDEPGIIVNAAEMTASGFRITGARPLLGRTLLDADERAGAARVVVLGYRAWSDLFAGDPDVVGRNVTLGAERATVVGVMPEGFGFPLVHEAWLPLQLELPAGQVRPLEGPGLAYFGRLTADASMEEARAQIATLGRAAAAASPTTHEYLQPQIIPYAQTALGLPPSFSSAAITAWAMSVNLPALLFVILVCGNVALLLFARAAAREGEMIVRNALGASRRRILSQLFVEALLLAGLAAVVGLTLSRYALGWWLYIVEVALLEGPLPFWFEPSLSPRTIGYALGLTLLAAALAGILPGLKVTRALPSALREASAGGGGFQVGGVWTVVIVCQITVTVVAPVVAVAVHVDSRNERGEIALPMEDDDFVTARIALDRMVESLDPAAPDLGQTYEGRLAQLEEALMNDPRVAGVTFAERMPRMYHRWREIEVEEADTEPVPDLPFCTVGCPEPATSHRLASSAVALDYFDVLGVEVLAGRPFDVGDLAADIGAVIVNESFVERVLGGRNPIGRRMRYVATEEYRDPDQEPGPWMEIVGVVEDLGTTSGYGAMGMYHPADLAETYPLHVAVHVPGGAGTFQADLLRAGFSVDPALRIDDVQTLAEIVDSERAFYGFWTFVSGGTAAIAMLLSLGGIYSVMSFTVTRRTREIGIRIALGSSNARVVTDILRRPLTQIGLGLLLGGVVLGAIFAAAGLSGGSGATVGLGGLFAAYMALMATVCLAAGIMPTRRALSVEPAEALRGDE